MSITVTTPQEVIGRLRILHKLTQHLENELKDTYINLTNDTAHDLLKEAHLDMIMLTRKIYDAQAYLLSDE